MEEDIKILEEFVKCNNIFIQIDKLKTTFTTEALENLINKLKEYKYGMTMISEICVDESKCHITSKDAIEEVRKYIIH